MKYKANPCNNLKTDIMEVNGKDFFHCTQLKLKEI